MKRLIYTDDSPKRFKVGDDSTNLTVVPIVTTDEVNTLVKISKNANVKVLIRNENTYITSITPVINDEGVVINSKNLGKMPAGQYFLELWVTTDNETNVYPDRGFLPLFINENAEGQTGNPITNVNADDLRNELKEWVTDQLKSIKPNDIDLSNYFDKAEVTDLVNSSKVDLTPYVKTVDADNKYLSKEAIGLDLSNRTLTVNDNTINIPETVDLSSYAKKDTVPVLAYDNQSNTLTLNGTPIKLSSTVDLSNYFNKEEVTELVNNSKVDLTPYLKTVDADNKYLSKGSIVLDTSARTLTVNDNTINIPSAVDLTGYAKTDTVPTLSYDKQTNTLTLNGTAIKLGSNVDLSNYFSKEEVTNLINNSKVDLSPYLKTADADNKYLSKGSIVLDASARTLTVNGTVINIPSAIDLTDYAKKDSVPALTYNSQTNTLNLNGTDIKLSSNVDLSNFYTKNEIDTKLSQSGAGSGTNVNDIVNKLGIAQFKTNFSPTLANGSVITGFNNRPQDLNLRDSSHKYEYLTLAKKGTTDVNPKPTQDDLNNAQDITNLDGVTLLNGYRWVTLLDGYGFSESTGFPFLSAWFFSSSLPYLSVRIVAYDVTNKKYVAVNKDNTGEPIIHLMPLIDPLTEGDLNSGTKVLMYADKDDTWVVKYLICGSYVYNDFAKAFFELPFYQAINIMLTGNPDPRGATNLVLFNGNDSQYNPDRAENNAPVTFFLTNLTSEIMKLGNETLDAQTALVYQYPDKTTGMFELKLKVPNNVDNWLISCYKGRHLVPFLKQVKSNGDLFHLTTSNDAFTPVYNGGPTSTQKEVTLYPFGIEPVHIMFTN